MDSHRGGNHTQALVEEGFGGFMARLGFVVDTEEVMDIEEVADITLEL